MSAIVNGKGTVGIRGGAVVGAPIITQFITTWKTDNAGTSTSTQISIPTTGTGYACTVDWGDGTSNSYSGTAPTMLHTYPSIGTYTVKISGTFPRIYFNNAGDKLKLLTIEYWGTGVWSGSMGSAFWGCTNLKINAPDVPNFAGVTSLQVAFDQCTFTSINLSGVNLSSCTTFNGMFQRCSLLKSINVSGWNLNTTSNVDMTGVFTSCAVLSAITGLNTWNTSKVTNTSGMFASSPSLKDLDVTGWNMSANTSMSSMFSSCTALTGITGVENWNISKVTNTSSMFQNCTSIKDLNVTGWVLNTTTGNTINIASMFNTCSSLSGLTGYENWDTRNVTNMASMFVATKLPSYNLSNWNVGKVTSVSTMFDSIIATDINLSNWNLSSCTAFNGMFQRCSLLKSINVSGCNLNTTSNVDMTSMFSSCGALTGITGINNWNTSKVTNTSSMFQYSTSLKDLDVTGWNMSANTSMSNMFAGCSVLSGITGIENWNLRSAGVTLTGMFQNTGLSTSKYTGIIVSWANYVNTNGGSPSSVNMTTQTGRVFQNSLSGGAGFANAGAARTYLTGTLPTGRGWTIGGDTVIA